MLDGTQSERDLPFLCLELVCIHFVCTVLGVLSHLVRQRELHPPFAFCFFFSFLFPSFGNRGRFTGYLFACGLPARIYLATCIQHTRTYTLENTRAHTRQSYIYEVLKAGIGVCACLEPGTKHACVPTLYSLHHPITHLLHSPASTDQPIPDAG